jgi:CRP-like cAMP-binding protein
VVALTDVAALHIPGEVVAQALHDHPSLSNQFARIWQARAEVLRRSAQQANEVTASEAALGGSKLSG